MSEPKASTVNGHERDYPRQTPAQIVAPVPADFARWAALGGVAFAAVRGVAKLRTAVAARRAR